MKVSFKDLQLDDAGRVVLNEAELQEVEALGLVMSGGTDGQTNSGSCINSSGCNNSINGQCTNAQGSCNGASNKSCSNTDPKPEEVLP